MATAETDALEVVSSDQILAIDGRMKSLVDQYVAPFQNEGHRVRALMSLMYDPDKLGLRYEATETRTAIDTVTYGGGNCISLANAFVALSRYAGLEAEFISARMQENWQAQNDLFFVSRHITARVKLESGAFATIEFEWIVPPEQARYWNITDERAFAEFYSNIAVDRLESGDLGAAVANLRQAIELDPTYTHAWNNLGVVFGRMGRATEAEQAYLAALRIDRSNLSALNNLELLYHGQGKSVLAAKLQKRLDQYRRRNPYYLIELAKEHISDGSYDQAVKLAKKAIRKQEDEHHFYFVLASAYAYMARLDKFEEYLMKAQFHAEGGDSQSRYQKKLELLHRDTTMTGS